MEEEKYMEMAFELAARAVGRTSPNPMVGAVLVKDGKIVGKGYHARAGDPHAEIMALRDAGVQAAGSTLYINLEPCCHHGRTGPCTEAVIDSGVSRVVAAMADPNPRVAGKGLARLREAGLEVGCGLLGDRAGQLNEVFIKYITTGMPFVALKAAVSLDGRIATRTGDSRWITGPEAREHGHSLRDRYDAIMVGIGTVLKDDPALTTRLPGRSGRDPVRVVLDSKARTLPGSKVISGGSGSPAIIAVTPAAGKDRIARLEEAGAVVATIPELGGRVDPAALMAYLAGREITSVLVEGGGQVHACLLEAQLADKVYWYIAPMIIGGREAPGAVGGSGADSLADAARLERACVHRKGQDVLVEGYIAKRGRI